MARIFVDFKNQKIYIGNKSPGDSFDNCGEVTGFNSSSIIDPKYTVKSGSKLSSQQIQRILDNFNKFYDDYLENWVKHNKEAYKGYETKKMSDVADSYNDMTFPDCISDDVIYKSVLGIFKKSKASDFSNKFIKFSEKANLTNSKSNYEKIFNRLLQSYSL